MKRIDALIHPLHWEDARSILEGLGARATVREVKTFGYAPPRCEVYRGSAYLRDVTPELELTLLVEDERVETAIAALETLGREGEVLVSAVDGIVHFVDHKRSPIAAVSAAPAVPHALSRALAGAARV